MARQITFHYTLRNDEGQVLDTSRGAEPLACTEGAGHIIEGLESVLRCMQPGETRKTSIAPERGYGLRDENLCQRVPRSALPVDGELRIGDRFQAGQDRHAPIVAVVAIEGGEVLLDANHPLAGATLHFEVELVSAQSIQS